MALEQSSYLIQKAAPIIMRELQPYITAKISPFLTEKVGIPLAKRIGLPLAKKVGIPLARRSGTFLFNRVAYPMINNVLFKGNLSTLLGVPGTPVKTLPSNLSTLVPTSDSSNPPSQTTSSDQPLQESIQSVNKKGLARIFSSRKKENKKNKRKDTKNSKTRHNAGPSGNSGLFGRRNRNTLLNYSNHFHLPSEIPNPITSPPTNPGTHSVNQHQPSQVPHFPPAPEQPNSPIFHESQGLGPNVDTSYQSSLFSRRRYNFDY
ncbi:hypothetical protein LPY66_04895 [Dehalobacter sp. DCM]|uniref:hypothetical protein n=1 Tax=Dehalobacter sp. DCM TaxID=2907827 RepID=UPI0030817425|nr:hypothetical protein LPY66_04895 [Dehalobacter sp. DCM]